MRTAAEPFHDSIAHTRKLIRKYGYPRKRENIFMDRIDRIGLVNLFLHFFSLHRFSLRLKRVVTLRLP